VGCLQCRTVNNEPEIFEVAVISSVDISGKIDLPVAELRCSVIVSNRSGGGNHHFRHLQWTANDVRKAEKLKVPPAVPPAIYTAIYDYFCNIFHMLLFVLYKLN